MITTGSDHIESSKSERLFAGIASGYVVMPRLPLTCAFDILAAICVCF